MSGTYPLGEGALDRFAAVVTPGRASAADEVEVLTGRRGRNILHSVEPVVDIGDVAAARAVVARTYLADGIARYVVALLDATRQHPRVRLGASTRGGVALVGLAKSHAAMAGRQYVVPDDVVSVADAALAHRVIVVDGDGSVRAGREVVAECLARSGANRLTTRPSGLAPGVLGLALAWAGGLAIARLTGATPVVIVLAAAGVVRRCLRCRLPRVAQGLRRRCRRSADRDRGREFPIRVDVAIDVARCGSSYATTER